MEEIKKILEEQGKAFEEFKKTNDARIEEIAKTGKASADTETKLAAINEIITAQKKEIDSLTMKANRPQIDPEGLSEDEREHKSAINHYLRKGDDSKLKAIEQKTMRAGSDPDGGYFLPDATTAAIERVAAQTVAMRGLASVGTCGGGGWKQPVVTSGLSSSWLGETSTVSAATTQAIAEIAIMPGIHSIDIPVYNTMLEDSSFDLETWLMGEAEVAFAEGEDAGFITGTGVNKPRGIAAYPWIANSSYAWGSVGYIVTGKSSAFADTNPANKLIDTVHALKPKYRNNGSWLMNDLTVAEVRKIQDGQGNYLWQPGLQAGTPDRLLNYPIAYSDNMADIGATSYSIAFGDFRAAYQIVDRRGITVLRNPYSTMGMTYFWITRRTGGGIKMFEAVKFLRFSA